MHEPIMLTDATLDAALSDSKPLLLLITAGDALRSDFVTAFKQAAARNSDVVFAQIDALQNPAAAQRFDVGAKPILIAWHCGETLARRVRPWGTDVNPTVELLAESGKALTPPAPVVQPSPAADKIIDLKKDKKVMQTKPVTVTDATFQQEAIDFSEEMPVLIDFWAEWCGPCRMVAPILDKIATEYAGKIRIAKVNVDENPALSQSFNIRSIPTLMAIKQRTIIYSQPGALPEPSMRQLVDKVIEFEIPEEVLKQQAQQQAQQQEDNAN